MGCGSVSSVAGWRFFFSMSSFLIRINFKKFEFDTLSLDLIFSRRWVRSGDQAHSLNTHGAQIASDALLSSVIWCIHGRAIRALDGW